MHEDLITKKDKTYLEEEGNQELQFKRKKYKPVPNWYSYYKCSREDCSKKGSGRYKCVIIKAWRRLFHDYIGIS